MEIKVGQVWNVPTGESFKIEKYDYPDGKFAARMRHMKTKEESKFVMEGEAIKLPLFLKQQQAVLETATPALPSS